MKKCQLSNTINKTVYTIYKTLYFHKVVHAICISILIMCAFTKPVFANLVVRPSQVSTAQTVLFDVGVPAQKNLPTVAVRLIIPKGVTDVTPNVKNGWTISVKTNGENVTEIDWTDGIIPQGVRDDFYFEAQVPEKETLLKWDAYQTNRDGSIISWSHAPTENPQDESIYPPYSTTRVISDFNVSESDIDSDLSVRVNFTVFLSVISFILSLSTFVIVIRRKK